MRDLRENETRKFCKVCATDYCNNCAKLSMKRLSAKNGKMFFLCNSCEELIGEEWNKKVI
jgi:hypothetical protein